MMNDDDNDPNGFGDEIDFEAVMLDDALIDAIANSHVAAAFKITTPDDYLIILLNAHVDHVRREE